MAWARDREPGSKTGSEQQHQCANGLLRAPSRTLRLPGAEGTDKPRVSRSIGRPQGDRGLQRGRLAARPRGTELDTPAFWSAARGGASEGWGEAQPAHS